jgi:hypothetical protein
MHRKDAEDATEMGRSEDGRIGRWEDQLNALTEV